jgi:HAD superfamily hydrolase (TIGR01549 family)
MTESIETVLFDFGGTLDADGIAWKERFYAHYRAEGLDIAADAFDSSFFTADDSLIGTLAPATDLTGTVRALVAKLDLELSRSGASAANGQCERASRVAARFLSEASAALSRNRPILQSLKERYRLGVVSNFYGNLEAVCSGAGLAPFFTALVDSHCVGAQKPDPAIFRAALAMLRGTPETTVFVGDSLRRDREGARRTGMRFVWMAPQSIKDAGNEASCQSGIEHVVTDLTGLMAVLQ